MLISISGLVFGSVKGDGFNSIARTKHGSHKEQKLVDGAKSQFTGRKLDKLNLDAFWIGADVSSKISELDILLTGEHQISDQDGNNLGVWTCDSITDNGTDVFGGGLLCHKVTLKLTEYR